MTPPTTLDRREKTLDHFRPVNMTPPIGWACQKQHILDARVVTRLEVDLRAALLELGKVEPVEAVRGLGRDR